QSGKITPTKRGHEDCKKEEVKEDAARPATQCDKHQKPNHVDPMQIADWHEVASTNRQKYHYSAVNCVDCKGRVVEGSKAPKDRIDHKDQECRCCQHQTCSRHEAQINPTFGQRIRFEID